MKIPALILAVVVALQTQIRVGVDAVRVDVLVTDGTRPIPNLIADDFEVRDSGVVQTIESVTVADVPISMMIALDNSSSVSGKVLQELKQGVGEAAAMLQPVDRAALITFSTEIRLATDWDGDFAQLSAAVERLSAGGGTALWDAAFAALAFPDEKPTVRRLVLMFSDGSDTSSWLSRAAVIDKARRTDAVVYGVEIRDRPTSSLTQSVQNRSGVQQFAREAPDQGTFLDELSNVSGGTTFHVGDASDLRKAFTRELTEFRTRYLITYTARGVERAGWHPIEVRLKTAKGKVTARRGYMR